jgi:hypothetical protein
MNKLCFVLILLALLFLPAQPAYALANGQLDGRVVIGQNFTLNSGETLSGDLVVIGGAATIESGATVNGNVVIIGGSLKLDGRALGDAVVIGGVASMGEKSSLSGDMVTLGGLLERAEGAVIGGNVVSNFPAPTLQIPNQPGKPSPTIPIKPRLDILLSPIWRGVDIIVQALALGVLAILLTIFLQPQLDRVAQAIVAQPFMVGSIGLLTAFLAPIALVVLVVTLILIPVALAAGMLLVLAWLFGVIALGIEVGDRLTKAIHQTWAPVLSAGFGTFVLMIIVGALNQVPCIGWMAGVLVGLIGIGAVVVTMFGTKPIYRPSLVPVQIDPPISG